MLCAARTVAKGLLQCSTTDGMSKDAPDLTQPSPSQNKLKVQARLVLSMLHSD